MTEPVSSTVSLADYVRDTLSEIIAGVRAAQDQDDGAMIGRTPIGTDNLNVSKDRQGNTVMLVRFDVATTVEEKQTGKIGGSVKVVAIGGIEGGGEKSSSAQAISRVSFVIPMAVPKPGDQREADERARKATTTGSRTLEDLGRELGPERA